ncbi:sphinganine C4-monooxygenase 2-like [Asparagus officinalis]|uniref:sphinganine C4-monooxygenase 2-like n=1 Tax=Asparagus officinalis TaxID=4686 RepID=UPI00098E74A8|nr:sphinganine C4-monooxygenase 2-like [Asparagus officinalis]XP_020255061.1 sphinganine C4-monooxygenase 2-like [Asparagus officinalis]
MENSSCSLPSDEVLAIIVPIAVYWVYSGFHMMLGSLDRYRLHPRKDEDLKNLVSKRSVAVTVLSQQLLQAAVGIVLFKLTGGGDQKEAGDGAHVQTASWVAVAGQFFVGMFVVDSWMYFWHRYMHLNRFLYKHVHSWHHRLVVPYSFGSQYNHPVEGFLMDTLGGALAFLVSGMTPRTSIFFFSFSTVKGINDHCGLWMPLNPFNVFFWNNTAYHDVHHQLYGSKYNFSQPFFITWDKILGTHMPFTVEKRESGGLEARPIKPKRAN